MKINIDQIIPILKKYGVQKASIFGSYAKGTQDEQSDLDLIIQPPKNMGIEFVNLKLDLEDSLKTKVDLLSYNGINKYFKKYILLDQKIIL